MKKNTLTIAMIIMVSCCFSKVPDTTSISNHNDLHRLVQFKGTENAVKDYFSEKKIKSGSDNIIAVFLPPMGCPRCEGLISPFLNDVKRLDSTITTAVFVFYSKPKPATQYLKERGYPADDFYILTSTDFLDNFYLSSKTLQVPFFVKFNIRSGDMILSKTTLGMDYNKDIAKAFAEANDPSEKPEKRNSILSLKSNEANRLRLYYDSLNMTGENTFSGYEIFPIDESNDFLLSEIRRISFSEDGKLISCMDDLTNSICVFKKEDDRYKLIKNIRAGEYENRLFFDEEIGDEMYFYIKKMNLLNSMYFNSKVYNNSVLISASLPDVFIEDKEKEKIGYMNKAVLLIKDIYDDDMNSFITPEINFSGLIADHTNAIFYPEYGKIFIPVSKGWPVAGHSSLPNDDPNTNPFLPGFYNFTPELALFEMNGKFQDFIGNLDTLHETFHLGYAFSKPIVKLYHTEYWIADSYSGAIRKFDITTNELKGEEARAFEPPIIEQSLLPFAEGTLEYIRSFNSFFLNYIVDFTVLGNFVISIIKSGDYFVMVRYDRNEKKIVDQKIIPNNISGHLCKSLSLRESDGAFLLMGLYESSIGNIVIEFTAPK